MNIRKSSEQTIGFYPHNKTSLMRQLTDLFPEEKDIFDAKAAIMPHAGYAYSGYVAAEVASKIKSKGLYIIIGFNHYGLGQPFSLMNDGVWQTPLGDIMIETKFANRLLEISKYLKADNEAHEDEHSIEVILPFLQYKQKPFKFIPISIKGSKLEIYREIGKELAECIKEFSVDATIIASSDFTHFENQQTAAKKDRIAIDAILKLDEKKFLDAVSEHNITVCGYSSIAVMLCTVKLLGAKDARLVKYQTSGDVSGDYESVVGYAGIIIT